ncbi:MAG: hypothetical protein ACRD3Q_05335 [Terriglobales bacterium]
MSTRSIIARATGEGTFKGVYHHWDGYPTGLGKYFVELLAGLFAGDLSRMLRAPIDDHPAGWSTVVGKDFSLKPGYTWEKVKYPSIHPFPELFPFLGRHLVPAFHQRDFQCG